MTSVLVLDITDLNRMGRRKEKDEITFLDFLSEPMKAINKYDMVIFMDMDGTSKLLKNRYD